jgi:hypothetical protein
MKRALGVMRQEVNEQPANNNDLQPIDRGFTYRVTIASLVVGIAIAVVLGVVIYGLAQPSTVNAEGEVRWSAASLLFPLSFIVALGILFWSVFSLPVRIAKRRGVVLDPEVWPWTGAVIIGVIVVVGFVVAMLAGVI